MEYSQAAAEGAIKLPFSMDAEQTVLGSILRNWDTAPVAIELLLPQYFYIEQHEQLFRVISTLFQRGTRADIITVLNESMKQKVFETENDAKSYLVALMDSVPSSSNIESYCKIVSEKYYMRKLVTTSQDIIGVVMQNEYDAQTMLDMAEQKVYDIRQSKDIRGLIPISDIIRETYAHLSEISGPDRDKFLGASSGFTGLDRLTTGLNRSDLILIAARPGMGKTSFAMNIAVNVARKNRESSVAVFNLEMSKEQLVSRLLSTEALVESQKLRTGKLSRQDWIKLAAGAEALNGLPILIDDSSALTVQQIKAKLRRVKNLGLVIIDYLGLMDSTIKTDNRVLIVTDITRKLKNMAKDLNVPIILLSQLNRNVESRQDKKPVISDLRDSGSIEQDADIVILLYRDDYYQKDSADDVANIAICDVAKNRHGSTGSFNLKWDGQFTRFANYETDRAPE